MELYVVLCSPNRAAEVDWTRVVAVVNDKDRAEELLEENTRFYVEVVTLNEEYTNVA